MIDSSLNLVSVVVPTACQRDRCHMILRALQSIEKQTYRPIEILFCANGDSVDDEILEKVSSFRDVHVIRLKQGSQKSAMVEGVRRANGSFYCFLDDDDELLSESVRVRAEVLIQNPRIDAVFSNGFVCKRDEQRDTIRSGLFRPNDLFGSLLVANWNASCATMFRAERFTADFFEEDYRDLRYGAHGHLPKKIKDSGFSWTFATAKLSLQHNIHYTPERLFKIHAHANSASNSIGYLTSSVAVWNAVLGLSPPTRYRKRLERKMMKSHHSLSELYLKLGDRARAVYHHVCSLGYWPSGLRYLTYTRHLLTPPGTRSSQITAEP